MAKIFLFAVFVLCLIISARVSTNPAKGAIDDSNFYAIEAQVNSTAPNQSVYSYFKDQDSGGFCDVHPENADSSANVEVSNLTRGTWARDWYPSKGSGDFYTGTSPMVVGMGDHISIHFDASTFGSNSISFDTSPSGDIDVPSWPGNGGFAEIQSQACGNQAIASISFDAPPAIPPDFSLTVTPDSQTIYTNGQASYTVTANCTGGFAGPVQNLSVNHGFTNMNFSFSSPTIPVAATLP